MANLIRNKDGLGLVEMFHQQCLNEQANWVAGMTLRMESRSIKDLAPRTKKQEQDLAWNDKAIMQF